MLKKSILSLALFTIIITNGFSQTKQEAIKDLFHLMKTDAMIDKTFNSIIPIMVQQVKAKNGYNQKKVDEVLKTSMNIVKEVSKTMINTDLVELYDKYFTEEEIQQFTAFHKTPTGQKVVDVLPDLQKEMMTIMMTKYMPEMRNKIMEATKATY